MVDNKARLRLALVKSVTHKKTKEAITPLEEPKDVIYKITEMLGTASKLMEEINRLVDAMTNPRYCHEMVNNILDIRSYVGVIKKTKRIQIWEEATNNKMVLKSFNHATSIKFHEELASNRIAKKSTLPVPGIGGFELANQH